MLSETIENTIQPPKIVLMFDGFKRLAAIFYSQSMAARAINVRPQSINHACNGKHSCCGGFYFRNYDPLFPIEMSDIGKLHIADYDQALGLNRELYERSKKTKVGEKWNRKRNSSPQK